MVGHPNYPFAVAGPLLVVYLGFFFGVFKLWFYANNRQDSWDAWGGGLSFSGALYALGVYFQYRLADQPLNVYAERIQYTGIVLLIHCAYGYVLSYRSQDTRGYNRYAGVPHALVLVLLWSSHLIIGDGFVFRRFLLLDAPYVEPRLTLFGQVLLVYFALAALNLWRICLQNKRFPPGVVVGISIWVLLGLHDALATLGMPTIHFLMEYGALAFITAVTMESFRNYFVVYKLAEERKSRIEKDKARLEGIIGAIGEGLVVVDSKGRIQLLNEAAAIMGGFSQAGALDRDFQEVFRFEGERKGSTGATYPAAPPALEGALEMVVSGGRRIPVARTETLLRDKAGDGVGKVFVMRDISALKERQQALMDSHRTLSAVLDSIDATIYVADLKTFEIIFMNRNMKKVFGENLEGRKCYQAFFGKSRPCGQCSTDELMDAAGQPAGPIVREGRNPVDDRWYVYYERALVWVDGRMARLQIATDITDIKTLQSERRRMAAKLQETRRMEAIATLAGGIAHDFNNLLMGIQGRTSLLLGDDSLKPEARDHIDGIDACIGRASILTRQLLGFACGGKYEARQTDMNVLIRETIDVFGRRHSGVAVDEEYEAGLWPVQVDRSQMEQVMTNILVNARQAMPDGGKIAVETRNTVLDEAQAGPYSLLPGSYVRIDVTDTGVGMDAVTLGKIFDPFFTTREKARGIGLGLASAYGIMRNHGGMIQVDSEPGQGAVFSLYLPASESAAQVATQPVAGVADPPGRRTVLLVDDETVVADIGKQMLERLGYETLIARNGAEAVEIYENQGARIDLVILDMVMPGLGGRETFQLLRKIDPSVKILLCSGYSLEGEAGGIMALGCNGFIQKPFSLDELGGSILAVLGEARTDKDVGAESAASGFSSAPS